MSARLQIFESDLDEIKSLSKFHKTFVFYILANIDVLKHVINVVDCFNSSRHWKKKKNKKKEKKKILWSFENRTERDKQRETKLKRLARTEKKRRKRKRFWSFEDRTNHEKQQKTKLKRSTKTERKKRKRKRKEKKERKNKKWKWWRWTRKKMIKMKKKNDLKKWFENNLFDDRRYNKERDFWLCEKVKYVRN